MKFCERFLDSASGTSKELEIKLINVARASPEELLEDYRDFLRVRKLAALGQKQPGSALRPPARLSEE